MGLQYNVQIMHPRHGEAIEGISGDFPRSKYGFLALITGQTPESVSQNGWSQLVDADSAQAFLVMVKSPRIPGLGHLQGSLIRLTIA